MHAYMLASGFCVCVSDEYASVYHLIVVLLLRTVQCCQQGEAKDHFSTFPDDERVWRLIAVLS
jgi:hypothetical protein